MVRSTALAVLFAASTLAEEGWVTHAVALSPGLESVVRGRMHAERGTSLLLIEAAETGVIRHELKGPGVVRAFAFSADGARFVATDDHGPLKIVETASGNIVGGLAGHSSWVHAVAFGGRHVASAGRDKTLRVWDVERGVELWRKTDLGVGQVALSRDGTRLATTDGAGRVHLWDAATGKALRTLDTEDRRWGLVLAFSPDGARIAAGNRRVRVFSVGSGATLATLEVHEAKSATALAFSPDGTRLATAGPDRSVRVWRIEDGSVERTWSVKRGVGALSFSGDGRVLGAAKYYGKCQFWDLKTGRESIATETRRDRPSWIAHSTGGDALLLSVAFFDEHRGLAVGGTGERSPSVIRVTPDDGQTWSACEVEAEGRLYAVDTADRTTAFAVGFDGLILRTKDRGLTWQKLRAPARRWLAAVDFVSPSTGYVVGQDEGGPVLWKTTDGGESWVSLAKNLPARARNASLRDVLFTTGKRGFAVGTEGLIVETEDGGDTWVVRESGTDAWLRAISACGELLHVAGKGVLLRSVDGGRTWKPLPIPSGRKLNDVAFVNEQVGWVTGFLGDILETRDGGRSWNAVYRHGRLTVGMHVSSERIVVAADGGAILRRRR